MPGGMVSEARPTHLDAFCCHLFAGWWANWGHGAHVTPNNSWVLEAAKALLEGMLSPPSVISSPTDVHSRQHPCHAPQLP